MEIKRVKVSKEAFRACNGTGGIRQRLEGDSGKLSQCPKAKEKGSGSAKLSGFKQRTKGQRGQRVAKAEPSSLPPRLDGKGLTWV